MHLSFRSCPFIFCAPDSVYESGWNRLGEVKLRLTGERDSWSCLMYCFPLFLSILQEALISLWQMSQGRGVKAHRAEFICQSSTEGFLRSSPMFHADDTSVWNWFLSLQIWELRRMFSLKHHVLLLINLWFSVFYKNLWFQNRKMGYIFCSQFIHPSPMLQPTLKKAITGAPTKRGAVK